MDKARTDTTSIEAIALAYKRDLGILHAFISEGGAPLRASLASALESIATDYGRPLAAVKADYERLAREGD